MNNDTIILLTQTGITAAVIIAWIYMSLTGHPSPALFDTVVGVIIGAYFTRNGKLLADHTTNAINNIRGKDKNEQ